MKAVLRIPTRHQYAYIELVVEGTQEEIIKQYLSFTAAYHKQQEAFNKKEEEDKPPFP